MARVVAICAPGSWNPAEAADHVTLDHAARHRRRFQFTAAGGTRFLLDEAQAVTLGDGDGLRLDDGRLIAVAAAPEPLMEVRARDAAALARLAWHIGNRHLAADIRAGAIRLRHDPVIAAMLRGLGAQVVAIDAPFTPESGAYAAPAEPHHHAH